MVHFLARYSSKLESFSGRVCAMGVPGRPSGARSVTGAAVARRRLGSAWQHNSYTDHKIGITVCVQAVFRFPLFFLLAGGLLLAPDNPCPLTLVLQRLRLHGLSGISQPRQREGGTGRAVQFLSKSTKSSTNRILFAGLISIKEELLVAVTSC